MQPEDAGKRRHAIAIKAETSFSLKDQLFNPATLARLAEGIAGAYPAFNRAGFEGAVNERLGELELKARIAWIVTTLSDYLPEDFDEAFDILKAALPAPLDATKGDGDFGVFIWIVPGEYVAKHGCVDEGLATSLAFLREATKRFSSEGAVRPFLRAYPEPTMAFMHDCAGDANYHVRRFASEGIRPFLPWAERVVLPVADLISVLDRLHGDTTRYVTRSVANTLNDLSKIDAECVIRTLERWRRDKKQTPKELAWMTRHALRTLLNRGDARVLTLLGYAVKPAVEVRHIRADQRVIVGEAFEWQCDIVSHADQNLLVFLVIHYRKGNDSLTPKVFRVKDVVATAGETIPIRKRQSFQPITTRTLYPGAHRADLVVNGNVSATRDFDLVES